MATYENKLKMQYLMRYIDAKRRAKAILDEIRNLEDLATKVTVTFNDMPGGGGADDQLGAIVSHIMDLKADMVTQAKTIKAEQQIVQAVIDAVDDPDQRHLLRLRYINGYKWEQVAVEMDYSFRHILRIHGAALAAVRIPGIVS